MIELIRFLRDPADYQQLNDLILNVRLFAAR